MQRAFATSVYYPPPLASRRGRGYSDAQFRPYVCVYVGLTTLRLGIRAVQLSTAVELTLNKLIPLRLDVGLHDRMHDTAWKTLQEFSIKRLEL